MQNTWMELRLDDSSGPWKAGKLHKIFPFSCVSNAVNWPSNVLTSTRELQKVIYWLLNNENETFWFALEAIFSYQELLRADNPLFFSLSDFPIPSSKTNAAINATNFKAAEALRLFIISNDHDQVSLLYEKKYVKAHFLYENRNCNAFIWLQHPPYLLYTIRIGSLIGSEYRWRNYFHDDTATAQLRANVAVQQRTQSVLLRPAFNCTCFIFLENYLELYNLKTLGCVGSITDK